MTNEEAQKISDQSRESDRIRGEKERNQSSKERVAEIEKHNFEKKQNKQFAESVLKSDNSILGRVAKESTLKEIAKQGRSVERRLAREINRSEQTGRISNWLAAETVKADASFRSSQQSGFTEETTSTLTASSTIALSNSSSVAPIPSKQELKQQIDQPVCALSLLVTSGAVWISAGTIAGIIPNGLDAKLGKQISTSVSGYISAKVVIDEKDGSIKSVDIVDKLNIPDNEDDTFYLTLGYYSYDDSTQIVTNYGCGSVSVSVCRNWFASATPFYGASLSR